MKTTLRAKIIIETDKYQDCCDDGNKLPMTLDVIEKEINNGHYILEWINANLAKDGEPVLIIKI